mmetsp:Transcript_19695/g.28990  ORF Transcript_19695/g.28990 Transcript_19695/m.28990 type:complete len:209 (-) Transcript_19695:39-665(-)|eukprot:CAMPEP_0195521678 /NCGR_PEP_ID=MMETSP0794_2-20130614/19160_1 /TAXON_ID=515487 /ORGANISM="Stephanopyxis turris, Strain CCMP 815" /LENGTH=208 /DNA_ID=CAMNT_0040651287 /DNA_START=76 /DNA_END=702 /DNA_ORIENTATION=+
MVKHNNVIPNIHCHKKYLASSRGPLKVRLSLNQATKKKSRRIARAAKAAAIAPRPLKKLRPAVHCPTQKYNSKVRLGRGFSLAEIKEAGLTARFAQTIGIVVDHRRVNKSQEGKAANVERIKAYMAKLILFPKKRLGGKPPTGLDSTKEECAAATQFKGDFMALEKPKAALVMEDVPDTTAYTTMRVARKETKVEGFRVSVENRKKKD